MPRLSEYARAWKTTQAKRSHGYSSIFSAERGYAKPCVFPARSVSSVRVVDQ